MVGSRLLLATYKVDVAEAEEDLARAQILPQVNVFGEWSENQIEYRGGLLAPLTENIPGSATVCRQDKQFSIWLTEESWCSDGIITAI